MSDTESLKLRLEDGEIDESNENEPSVLPETFSASGIVKELRVIVKNFIKADKTQNDQPPSAVFDDGKQIGQNRRQSSEGYNSEKVYVNDQEICYMDEDEMLCVRGASPVPFVVERLSYSRKSPLQDCETISLDTTPPKKRRTSGKRRRKRTTPKKIVKDKSLSPDEHNEQGNSNFKEGSQSPQETQDKLPQLCKFYLQDCCVKRSKCKYMHSEFPCKFYYMGLKCEDETSVTRCKLSHGGSLSTEMVNALERHINTAPIDVLGQVFVDMRSKMQVSEMNQMLHETQDNLTPQKNFEKKKDSLQIDASSFFVTLKEKLYFLNEDQLNGLRQLEITKVDDLLNLTLAQLNAIGIHATQIEAIQMGFVAGQDTDMRNILPTQLEVPIKENVPNLEVVCYNGENTCGQNWYEQEEGPLVIDETNDADDDENETPEDDGIIIDVVGDSNSDSDSNIIEEEIDKVKHEVAVISAADSTDQSQHFVIEETQEGIQVHPNSMLFVNKSPATECSKTINKINQKELEMLQNFEKLPEEIHCPTIQDDITFEEKTKNLEELQTYEEVQDDIDYFKNQADVQLDENREGLEVLKTSEDLKEKVEFSKTKDKTEQNENKKELEVLPIPEELPEQIQYPKNQTHSQIDKDTKNATKVLEFVEDMNEKSFEIETLKDETRNYILSPKTDIKQSEIPQKEEQALPVPLGSLEKDKSALPHLSIKIEEENKHMCTPHSENVVTAIDLTVKTPPRRSTESSPPVRFKSEPKREYINPFHRKPISRINETEQHSPINKQRKKFIHKSNFKRDYQMQGDNSSEDWDADERSDIQSPPQEIASPDQIEDVSTPFVADGTCPELPRRTKNLDNYQPASEINAHLTYPPIEYKLYEIYMPQYEVNKPTLVEKLIKGNSTDPRLKKFIEKEKNHGIFPQAEYSFFPPNISQCDPRLRPGTGASCQDQYYNVSRLLYSYLQRSQWYQELKSNLKIQINHSVSDLVRALNFFHKDPTPQKIFDLFQIECAGVLLEVMRNVGIFIDANGNITEEANYKQLCAPLQQQQPPQAFPSGYLGPNTKPGLLGFAPPGVPHPHQNNSPMSSENSFARQAFGHDCMCNNNNNEFQPIGPTFYVGGQFPMNRNQEPGFDPGFVPPPSYQRQNQKRHFKRR